jgi:hypothetical protein
MVSDTDSPLTRLLREHPANNLPADSISDEFVLVRRHDIHGNMFLELGKEFYSGQMAYAPMPMGPEGAVIVFESEIEWQP